MLSIIVSPFSVLRIFRINSSSKSFYQYKLPHNVFLTMSSMYKHNKMYYKQVWTSKTTNKMYNRQVWTCKTMNKMYYRLVWTCTNPSKMITTCKLLSTCENIMNFLSFCSKPKRSIILVCKRNVWIKVAIIICLPRFVQLILTIRYWNAKF